MAMAQAAILLLLSLPVMLASLPGMMIQVNQPGIDQFTKVGVGLLNNMIPGTHIPDTSGKSAPTGKSLFTWSLTNIIIRTFHDDPAHTIPSLHPPDNVAVSIGNLQAEITADYHIKLGEGWLSISKDGDLTASTSDASAALSVDVTDASSGHPSLTPHSCSSNLGDLQVHFHGGIIDDIIDLFEKYVADYVKDKVSGIICEQVQSLITAQGNNFLRQVPLSVQLPDPMTGFHLDYGLTENPICTPSYIAVPVKAKFWYNGHENDGAIPPPHGTIAPANSPKMLCLDFDADEIFGSAAYALMVSDLNHLTIDQNVLGPFGPAIQKFMRCHCSDGLCIGALIPAIQAHCPEGGVVDVSAQASEVVQFFFNSSGAFGELKGTATFQSNVPDEPSEELFHITLTADLEVPSTLRFEGWKLKGQVLVTGADFQLGSSAIGDVDLGAIRQIWDAVLKVVVEATLNKLLVAGIPLPEIPDIRILNEQIWFGAHALTFCADAQYSG